MTVITMSRKELTRLRVLIDVADGRLSRGCVGSRHVLGHSPLHLTLDRLRLSENAPGSRCPAGAMPRRARHGGSFSFMAESVVRIIMLTDRYGLLVSTTSSAARDAYGEGCKAKLTMYPGAIEAFDRAVAADPGFTLAHAAKAHALLERGDAAAARASMAAANSLIDGLSAREASHVAFFDLLVAGEAEAALPAVLAHLNAWARDARVLGTTAFTNGLIGSSGRARQKRRLLELLEELSPSYGDDWWFTAHHGMALSENGQREAARPKIERSLSQNHKNPWAAHAC